LAATDTSLTPATAGPAPAVSAIAYTNNTPGAALTTIFGIDGPAATLVRIGGVDGTPSPNGGVVTTIGSLGVTPDAVDIGFDITPSGVAYAAFAVAGISNLYTIDLASGTATLVGRLGPGNVAVRGLAITP
jgi:hypothetical protein